MASVEAEFRRFINHLEGRNVSADARRLANLVVAHLPALAEVGAVRRARSSRLAPIAITQLAQTPVHCPAELDEPAHVVALGRLHQLEVGPFRGFMRQERFDLSHDVTLIYGANGTGKSSFCEALETAMLGSVSEAQVKRVDHRIYCDNARLRRHVAPVLTSSWREDELVAALPNENEYRFCFIEKNRIDGFARIAARAPSDQRQLIATLFGVDQFSDFVRGFNLSLDENLTLTGARALLLEQKRAQLAMSEKVIWTHPERLAQFQLQEQELAQRISPGHSFQACCEWMLGSQEQQGRLPFVQSQLDAVPPLVHNITELRLREMLAEAYRLQALYWESKAQLAARAGEVAYSQLYRAVLDLAEGATACPACATPLKASAQNPFERARAGLLQLAELSTIQEREIELRNQLAESVRAVRDEIQRVLSAATTVCPAALQTANLPQLPQTHLGDWLSAWIDSDQRAWNALLSLAAVVERSDGEAQIVHAQRGALALEREKLDGLRLEVERYRILRSTAQQEFMSAQQTVAQFNETNRELIAEVALEADEITHQQRVKAAYDDFLRELQGYLAALPGRLLQGLGEQAKELYNAFNRGGHPNDRLHALRLPFTENGKVEVEFAGEMGVQYDALVLFSEGHIKCLGLAILLAKNIAQGCPIVIFDDVVNAIDDEHRDGIWRTFFEDGLLDGKQIILTSHAEEFLHRIQQELGARRAGAIKRYKFLPHLGEHEIRLDTDPPTKNYVILAQQALANDEKRDALRYARPALESLTDRIWTWLGRRADGRLELKLSGPRSPWELNNKCMKLRSAVERIADRQAGAPEVVIALSRLLGVSGGSIEWGYLNGGVHDAQRDHEFDRATVRTIVESMEALDFALETLLQR